MYEEYCVTLPGGYVLPIALAADVYTGFSVETVPRQSLLAQAELMNISRANLKNQMIAGEILEEKLKYAEENGGCMLQGQVLCREMIGQSRQEKIGESYGKNR